MSLSNSGSFYVDLTSVSLRDDWSCQTVITYRGVLSGRGITARTLFVPSPSTVSGSITDDKGAVIAASVPAGLSNAISTFMTQIQSALSGAVNSGKLDI